VERAVLLCERDVLQPEDFETIRGRRDPRGSNGFDLPAEGVDLEALEKDLVMQALARTGGNQTRAASLLSLHRDQIRYRLEKYRKES
jgi:DNA-binding NtrC family response regulator